MKLAEARRLKPGEWVVALEPGDGLGDWMAGDAFPIQSCTPYSTVKAARWLTFGKGDPQEGGELGLCCYAFAPLFDVLRCPSGAPLSSHICTDCPRAYLAAMLPPERVKAAVNRQFPPKGTPMPTTPSPNTSTTTAQGPFCSMSVGDRKGGSGFDLLTLKRHVQNHGNAFPPPGSKTEERTLPMEQVWLLPDLLASLDWLTRCASIKGPVGTIAYIVSDEQMERARSLVAQAKKGA